MYNETFFPIVSGVFSNIHKARMAPQISASNVLCFNGGPKKYWRVFSGLILFLL